MRNKKIIIHLDVPGLTAVVVYIISAAAWFAMYKAGVYFGKEFGPDYWFLTGLLSMLWTIVAGLVIIGNWPVVKVEVYDV